jgi:hypothetical protein
MPKGFVTITRTHQIPYLYCERNWADYNGLVSKHKRIDEDKFSRARGHGHTHASTLNQKEKLNGRNMPTTLLYLSACEIPFGVDKTNCPYAQKTRKST